MSPPAVIPAALFNVRLFKSTDGSVVVAPLPPMIILVDSPPSNVPVPKLIDPVIVIVLSPIIY